MGTVFARSAAPVLFSLSILSSPVVAAENATTVNVALLDVSSVMGSGMMGMMAPGQGMVGPGQGMMGPGGPGWGMMGPGQGMMGPGAMGPGWGMIGPGRGMMGMGMMGMGMMGMMSIRTDQATIRAGEVHFVATNWSRGLVHEMLVVAVDNPSAPLPYDYGNAAIPEEQIKDLGEIGELQPNGTGVLDVTLDPGSYLLICNVAGHYAAGMVTPLTVTP